MLKKDGEHFHGRLVAQATKMTSLRMWTNQHSFVARGGFVLVLDTFELTAGPVGRISIGPYKPVAMVIVPSNFLAGGGGHSL